MFDRIFGLMLGQHAELPRRQAGDSIEFAADPTPYKNLIVPPGAPATAFVATAAPPSPSTGSIWERGYVPGQPPAEKLGGDGLTVAEEMHQHLAQQKHTDER